MSDGSFPDPTNVATMLVIIVVALAILIHLVPVIFQAVLQVMPTIAILLMIGGVLHGMFRKLLD